MMHTPFKNYPGNKGVSGLYQAIINLMPVHDVYIELFLGQGEILRRKKPAALNIGNDIDPWISYRWKCLYDQVSADIDRTDFTDPGRIYFSNLPAPKVISIYAGHGKKVLFYADPPYLRYTRKSHRRIYRYEMMEESGHIELLNYAAGSPHMWIISGYDCDLYNLLLPGWNKKQVNVSTRGGGTAIETIWFNFPEPRQIHDSTYLGKDFTDRQRIKRKVSRWIGKFEKLPDLERNLIFEELKKKSTSLASI